VATDAGPSRPLAWVGAGAAAFLVTLGPAFRSPTPVHCGVALLGGMLLLRQDARLMLAPLYGAGLLLVEELAWRSTELRDVDVIGPGVITTRVTAVLAVAAVGACAGAGAAIAVTVAPGRSVIFTAIGAIAVVAAFGTIAHYARKRFGTTVHANPATDGSTRESPSRDHAS
jgi:hypothetical protein